MSLDIKTLLTEIAKLETIFKMHYLLLSKFQTLDHIFAAFDRNEDEFIDEVELNKGFLIFCNYKDEENIKLFLNYFDRDGDGKISISEWSKSSLYIANDVRSTFFVFCLKKLAHK